MEFYNPLKKKRTKHMNWIYTIGAISLVSLIGSPDIDWFHARHSPTRLAKRKFFSFFSF